MKGIHSIRNGNKELVAEVNAIDNIEGWQGDDDFEKIAPINKTLRIKPEDIYAADLDHGHDESDLDLSDIRRSVNDAHELADSAHRGASRAQTKAEEAYSLASDADLAAGTAQNRANEAFNRAVTAESTAITTANQFTVRERNRLDVDYDGATGVFELFARMSGSDDRVTLATTNIMINSTIHTVMVNRYMGPNGGIGGTAWESPMDPQPIIPDNITLSPNKTYLIIGYTQATGSIRVYSFANLSTLINIVEPGVGLEFGIDGENHRTFDIKLDTLNGSNRAPANMQLTPDGLTTVFQTFETLAEFNNAQGLADGLYIVLEDTEVL